MTKGFAADGKSETDGGTDGRGLCNVLFSTPQRTTKIFFFYLQTLVRAEGWFITAVNI